MGTQPPGTLNRAGFVEDGGNPCLQLSPRCSLLDSPPGPVVGLVAFDEMLGSDVIGDAQCPHQ